MKLIDWIIVGILGLSVLIGLYRGFISSVASMGGCLVSLGASYWLTPKIVESVTANTTLSDTIRSYTDAAVRVGDIGNAKESVIGLSPEKIAEVVENVKLPAPLDSLLESNLKIVGGLYC